MPEQEMVTANTAGDETHVAIVGAYGSAGIAAAQRLAAEPDIRLTLLDDGDPGGGLCILHGCMPSKAVLSAAEHRFGARHDPRLEGGVPTLNLEEVIQQKDEKTAEFAAHRRASVAELAGQNGVEFIDETARFVDSRTLDVGGHTLDADYIVIATGSRVNLPALDGIENIDPMTSADVLDATTLPDSGLVMGFGYVGMELVPYLAEAGVDLTVIEHDARPLDEADTQFGDALLEYYRDVLDIEILTETREQRVTQTDDGVRLVVNQGGTEQSVTADRLFTFTGRQPSVNGLNLDRAGLSLEPGWVDDTMQTAENERVFVVGDANGKEPILHVAKEQGVHAAQNIIAHRENAELTSYTNTHHHVVFSGLAKLPYARVGHSQESAESADLDPIVVTRSVADDGVFRVKHVPDGLARLLVAQDGTVLGWQGLHYHADVMAKTMQLVVEMEVDVREIPDRAYHPTTPEIIDGLVRDATTALAENKN